MNEGAERTPSRGQQRRSTGGQVRRAIILYADMLGFSHKVESANPDHEASSLISRLDHFATQFSSTDFEDTETHRFFDKKYWAFSDSLVVCWYSGSEAQRVMTEFDADLDQLSGIALAQGQMMLTDGQLVRGGIAGGWFVEHGNTVVGAALVKAARIEKEIKMPFIGVEPELYNYYLRHGGRRQYSADSDPAPRLFIAPCQHTNQKPALDYFMVTLDEIDLSDEQIRVANALPSGEERDKFRNRCWQENRRSYAVRHRDLITRGLATPDPSIQQKYGALKQHHNTHVVRLYPNEPNMLVP
jgi:hypothetical protein